MFELKKIVVHDLHIFAFYELNKLADHFLPHIFHFISIILQALFVFAILFVSKFEQIGHSHRRKFFFKALKLVYKINIENNKIWLIWEFINCGL